MFHNILIRFFVCNMLQSFTVLRHPLLPPITHRRWLTANADGQTATANCTPTAPLHCTAFHYTALHGTAPECARSQEFLNCQKRILSLKEKPWLWLLLLTLSMVPAVEPPEHVSYRRARKLGRSGCGGGTQPPLTCPCNPATNTAIMPPTR